MRLVNQLGMRIPHASGVAVTWDPANKQNGTSPWVLTNGNLTANGEFNGWIKATLARVAAATAYSFECHIDSSGTNNPCFGIGDSGAVTGYPGQGVGENAFGYYTASGQKTTNGTGPAYGATCLVGDYVGVKVSTQIEFFKNGVSQGVAFTGLSGTFFPMWGPAAGINGVTANFGATAFAFPLTGSTSWDGGRVM